MASSVEITARLVKPMDKREALNKIPREGFLKITGIKNSAISQEQKIALIRKGNELFNAGEFDQAKKIFLATGYSDGIIRMGDHYSEKNNPLEALRMYWIAPSPAKVQNLMEKFASIVGGWLLEDKGTGKNEKRRNTRSETAGETGGG